jgi:hypothetical protein
MKTEEILKLSWDDPRRIAAVRKSVEDLTAKHTSTPGAAFKWLLDHGYATEDRKAVNLITRP